MVGPGDSSHDAIVGGRGYDFEHTFVVVQVSSRSDFDHSQPSNHCSDRGHYCLRHACCVKTYRHAQSLRVVQPQVSYVAPQTVAQVQRDHSSDEGQVNSGNGRRIISFIRSHHIKEKIIAAIYHPSDCNSVFPSVAFGRRLEQ